jgi:hypothetical protein
VDIDTREYEKFNHGYAITLYKSQGKTYDNTIVLANRHREKVDLYYSKSDFRSFSDLVGNMSKYVHKDSLEDYRNMENQNKSRVFEYKEMLLETVSVLKDINCGEVEWKEYYELNSKRVSLGREILSNYDVHRLYLNQLGITREKLEIGVGVRKHPLSKVELNAKNRIAMYAKASCETRQMFNTMKKEVFNVTQHDSYSKYSEMRGARNELAKEIL